MRKLAVLPAVLLVLYFLPGSAGWLLPEIELTSEGEKTGRGRGKKARREKSWMPASWMDLMRKRKKELEKLQAKIDETAKSLQEGNPETARDVLAELERRARDAERMAEKLGAGDAAWASEQMINEMRKHADTAEIGDAAASKSAENTGKQAQQLADILRDEKLTNEAHERFEETLYR